MAGAVRYHGLPLGTPFFVEIIWWIRFGFSIG